MRLGSVALAKVAVWTGTGVACCCCCVRAAGFATGPFPSAEDMAWRTDSGQSDRAAMERRIAAWSSVGVAAVAGPAGAKFPAPRSPISV